MFLERVRSTVTLLGIEISFRYSQKKSRERKAILRKLQMKQSSDQYHHTAAIKIATKIYIPTLASISCNFLISQNYQESSNMIFYLGTQIFSGRTVQRLQNSLKRLAGFE